MFSFLVVDIMAALLMGTVLNVWFLSRLEARWLNCFLNIHKQKARVSLELGDSLSDQMSNGCCNRLAKLADAILVSEIACFGEV